MNKWLTLYAGTVLALASTLAFGQLTSTGAGKKAVPASAYSGPGDIVAGATAWYGLRAYSAADRGNRLLNVCNVADIACADLSSDATTGALVISTIGGSSCSVVTCTIKTMYDRSGNGSDITQATISGRPTLTVNCVGGKPCASCVSQGLLGTVTTTNQPYTFSIVAIRTGATTARNAMFSMYTTGSMPIIGAFNSNSANMYSGTEVSATMNDNAWHAVQAVYNGGSSVLNIDNTNNAVNPNNGAGGTTISFCRTGNGAGNEQYLTGNMTEAGLWTSAFSVGSRTSMCHNQFAYWGTSVSC